MRRILLQRRQSVANNAIQNCAFLVGKKRIGRDEKRRKKERRYGALYITGVWIERAEEMRVEKDIGRV